MVKKLPIGLQDFRGIIEDGYKYIDKTRYVHKMCTSGKFYFLARPRRFGKSITVALLQELYSGSKELFKGLWIENQWDWSKKHPVIRISLKDVNFEQLGLEKGLFDRVLEVSGELGVKAKTNNARDQFRAAIHELGTQQKVVVLIDEYDAPIVHYLGKEIAQALQNREYLKSFYSVLKEMDRYLELVFITGVSKFSKVGIFSGLNNLDDLTMHPHYANMLGYTQSELEEYFPTEISATAQSLQLDRATLLDQVRWWYNGYRFHLSAETVYNPVSLNMFFNRQEFKNFWFETGTPSFLINILKEKGLYNFHLTPQSEQTFDTFDLEELNPFGLLYQTGYLTLKSRTEFGAYLLDFPNHEVQDSMNGYLLEAFSGIQRGDALTLVYKLETLLCEQKVDQAMGILQAMFKTIPYQLHEQYPEKFFHAAIHLLFTYMGLKVQSEVCTSDGRVDAMVETPTHIYIFEFKLDESAEAALTQIRRKAYYQAFWQKGKPVFGIGVNISSQSKNIEEWTLEAF